MYDGTFILTAFAIFLGICCITLNPYEAPFLLFFFCVSMITLFVASSVFAAIFELIKLLS